MVAEEADRLEDDGFVAFGGQGLEGIFDRGAEPGGAGDALRLEGEEPVLFGEADGGEKRGDAGGGLFALDGVGVGYGGCAVVLDAVSGGRLWGTSFGCWGNPGLQRRETGGTRSCAAAGEDGAAGDGVGGEEDGDVGARNGAGFGPDGPELFGECEGEEGFVGPAGDKVEGEGLAGGVLEGGFEGLEVEASAGAGILGREAEDAGVGDAVLLHLGDDVGDVGVPVAHADVDRLEELVFEEDGLAEGPAGEGWALGERGFAEADFGIAMLELFDDGGGHGAAAGDALEVFGHFAEDVRSAVGEEEDGSSVRHACLYGSADAGWLWAWIRMIRLLEHANDEAAEHLLLSVWWQVEGANERAGLSDDR